MLKDLDLHAARARPRNDTFFSRRHVDTMQGGVWMLLSAAAVGRRGVRGGGLVGPYAEEMRLRNGGRRRVQG